MRRFFKQAINILGLDIRLNSNIRKHEGITWEAKQAAMWNPFLSHLNIRTVIDVGANTGQFANLIHRQCPDAQIISFEPLDSCQPELSAVLDGIPGSRIVKKAAGEHAGKGEINESEFSPCSSLLAGTEFLGEDYDSATRTSTKEIEIVPLDDELRNADLQEDILVKFDVQGFEIPAIRGGHELLSKARIVVCEICFFRKLYEGQPLFHDLYKELRSHGFTYMGNAEQMSRKSDGRIVEADAIFERLTD